MHGYHGGTTFDGFGGNNTLLSSPGGGDTFVFNVGYGHELAIPNLTFVNSAPDVVQLGAGITPDMVELSRPVDPLDNSFFSARDLVIQIAGTGDSLTIRNEFFYFGAGSGAVREVRIRRRHGLEFRHPRGEIHRRRPSSAATATTR